MIKKIVYLLIVMITVSLSACVQKKINLVAKVDQDTVYVGASVRVSLILEGVTLHLTEKERKGKSSALDDFFGGAQIENKFSSSIFVYPQEEGFCEFGPFKVSCFGDTYYSNTVSVYAVKRQKEVVDIVLPKTAKVGEVVEIKVLNISEQSYDIKLDDIDGFQRMSTSSSVSITNGETSRIYTLRGKFTESGEYEFNAKNFKNLSHTIQVNGGTIEVHK